MKRPTFITWDQLKVGALILVAIAALTFAVVRLGQAAHLFTSRYALVALLPNASGLRVGGQVTVAGQLAGSIRAIEFLPPDGDTTRNLRLVLEVEERLREQVRADSRGKLRTLGLLGDKVVDISPGTPRYQVLEEGDTLIMGESLDYDAILAQAGGAVSDMVELTRDLKSLTGGLVRGEGTVGQLVTNRALYDNLTTTLGRTNQLITRLQRADGTIARLVEDPTLYQNLTRLVVSVDSLVLQLNSREGTLGKLLHDDTLYTHLVGVASGTDSLVRSLTRGNGLAARLLTDQQLYDQLLKAVTDLNAVLEDVRRDPRRYTKGMIQVF